MPGKEETKVEAAPVETAVPTGPAKIEKVTVHPLVLLSVVDHYTRMRNVGNVKRVTGVLLGQNKQGVLDISNSFAVPFDEDERDSSVWFLDHDYLETMFGMFRKVSARERVVGWYHTGPKLRPNDISINEKMRNYCPNSVLVIVDVQPHDLDLPTKAYRAVEEVHDDGTPTSKTFEHLPSDIGAEEAEEVGVEHLLRDIRSSSVGTLSQRITTELSGLRGLLTQLQVIQDYLVEVADGKLPMNHQIIYLLQDIFNLLPDVTLNEFVRSVQVNTNDQMVAVYIAALVRAVIALHNLINNQLANRDSERADAEKGKKRSEAVAAAKALAAKEKEAGDTEAKKEEKME